MCVCVRVRMRVCVCVCVLGYKINTHSVCGPALELLAWGSGLVTCDMYKAIRTETHAMGLAQDRTEGHFLSHSVECYWAPACPLVFPPLVANNVHHSPPGESQWYSQRVLCVERSV